MSKAKTLLKALSTAALIAAHRDAKQREADAAGKRQAIRIPDSPSITLYDIGPRCIVHDPEEVNKAADHYIRDQGLSGLEAIEFRDRMKRSREAIALAKSLYDDWKRRSGWDDAVDAEADAQHEESAAFNELVARLRAGKDKKTITAYLVAADTGGFGWQPAAILKALVASL
jgi:hypothetical protein